MSAATLAIFIGHTMALVPCVDARLYGTCAWRQCLRRFTPASIHACIDSYLLCVAPVSDSGLAPGITAALGALEGGILAREGRHQGGT